ncbi:unnamed protein product [Periconia digitata]|uniref:Uncharacterized protein n=1 Tax=Periconia digitata TaxID=1303443 RepID=A0A9W4UU59_9PLEO|nr:unnamed protein product [Periconia digitata]
MLHYTIEDQKAIQASHNHKSIRLPQPQRVEYLFGHRTRAQYYLPVYPGQVHIGLIDCAPLVAIARTFDQNPTMDSFSALSSCLLAFFLLVFQDCREKGIYVADWRATAFSYDLLIPQCTTNCSMYKYVAPSYADMLYQYEQLHTGRHISIQPLHGHVRPKNCVMTSSTGSPPVQTYPFAPFLTASTLSPDGCWELRSCNMMVYYLFTSQDYIYISAPGITRVLCK